MTGQRLPRGHGAPSRRRPSQVLEEADVPMKTSAKLLKLRAVPASGPLSLRPAAPGWKRFSGWCAQQMSVGTDGRNLLCAVYRH